MDGLQENKRGERKEGTLATRAQLPARNGSGCELPSHMIARGATKHDGGSRVHEGPDGT